MDEISTSPDVAQQVKRAAQDAVAAIRLFGFNPTGGLSSAFETLDNDDRRAMGVGFIFALVFDVCLLCAIAKSIGSMQQVFNPRAGYGYGYGSGGYAPSGPGAGFWFKLLLAGLVPCLSIAAASALARKALHGAGSFGGDVFLAGASLIPMGLFLLLAGLLGLANIEVVLVVLLFALCYTILMLYTGCHRISGIPESGSALAVPLILVVSGWLSKILFAMILGN